MVFRKLFQIFNLPSINEALSLLTVVPQISKNTETQAVWSVDVKSLNI